MTSTNLKITILVDLSGTNILVLSHGHYDHTGGLPSLFQRARNLDVYCHPGVGRPRYSIRNGKPKLIVMQPDLIEDDLALWAETMSGIVVCVGCCHAGLVNTLNHVRRLAGGAMIHTVIGGFHLINAGRERLEKIIAALRHSEPAQIVPCHCTGEAAVTALRGVFWKRVSPGAVGRVYQF